MELKYRKKDSDSTEESSEDIEIEFGRNGIQLTELQVGCQIRRQSIQNLEKGDLTNFILKKQKNERPDRRGSVYRALNLEGGRVRHGELRGSHVREGDT